MKHKIFLSLAFALTVLNVLPVAAEDFRTDINPALRYYQAFLLDGANTSNRDLLLNTQWLSQNFPQGAANAIGSFDNAFKMIRQAAKATVPCDWGIDMSAGPETLLPHLGRLKQLGGIARVRAMWRLQEGDLTGAAEELSVTLTMGRNASRDGTLISVLVQFAIEDIVYATIGENFYRFPSDVLSDAAARFATAPSRGTIASAMQGEKANCGDWFGRKIAAFQQASPGDDRKVMEEIEKLITRATMGEGPSTNVWPQILQASDGTSDGVLRLFEALDPIYVRLASLTTAPLKTYDEQMPIFAAEVAGSTNPVVGLLIPALEKCRPREMGIMIEAAMVEAAIQYKAHGAEAFRGVIDPAGVGPFEMLRFTFNGVDRGFELKSVYEGRGFPEVMIFVESDGPPFNVHGKNAGKAVQP